MEFEDSDAIFKLMLIKLSAKEQANQCEALGDNLVLINNTVPLKDVSINVDI